MAKTRDQMLAAVMLERADVQVANWVRRFDKGFSGAITKADVAELAEFIDLRDQLRAECAGMHTEAPALPVSGEVVEDAKPYYPNEDRMSPSEEMFTRGHIGNA